tara:strand:+ start:64 stop:1125 length:1062 start_codon:yes stop_codon:yes gene_type:complete
MLRTGSRCQVMHGNAQKTTGGLTQKDLIYNKNGHIVSKKMSIFAKKENRLEKAGYITTKGMFGVKQMNGGDNSINNNNNFNIKGSINNDKSNMKGTINNDKSNIKPMSEKPANGQSAHKTSALVPPTPDQKTNQSKGSLGIINAKKKEEKNDAITEAIKIETNLEKFYGNSSNKNKNNYQIVKRKNGKVNPSNEIYIDKVNNIVYKLGLWEHGDRSIQREVDAYDLLQTNYPQDCNIHYPKKFYCKMIKGTGFALLKLKYIPDIEEVDFYNKSDNNQKLIRDAQEYLSKIGIKHNDEVNNLFRYTPNETNAETFLWIDFEAATITTSNSSSRKRIRNQNHNDKSTKLIKYEYE